jgi:hypothetical protein
LFDLAVIKKTALSFHNSVEQFFEERKKEASLPRAILTFTLLGFLISLWTALPTYEENIGIINYLSVIKLNLSWIINTTLFNFAIILALLGTGLVSLWFIGNKLLKSKTSIETIFYLGGLPFLLASVLLSMVIIIGPLIPPLLTFIFLPLFIIFSVMLLYLTLVAIKIAHETNYIKAIILLLIANLATAIAVGILLFWMWPSFGLYTQESVFFVKNMTNHSDGSFTVTYAYISNRTGIPKEVCYVTFPSGWLEGDEEMVKIIAPDINKKRIFYKVSLLNSTEKEYFAFESLLINFGPGLIKSQKDAEEEEVNPLRESINLTVLMSNNAEVLDIKFTDVNKSIVRHKITARFPNWLGFEAIYQSPYGQDQDLQYILNNFNCYKK